MLEIGFFLLGLALIISLYAFVSSIVGARSKRPELIKSAENGVISVFLLSTLASLVLIYAFVTKDFSFSYVASYSNQALPLLYTISAFWAGQEGSLLLWQWLLALFSFVVFLQNRRQNQELMPYVISVLMGISAFFLTLLVFSCNPFKVLAFLPVDGQGLNPLLQNPGMLIHPPTLYIGFVGFAVPFAFAIAALITSKLDDTWIRTTRRWTLIAWFFLGIGNLLGAQWAYVELGWGGYWAWDPVENASLMPWLLGTAYLHSVMIQERKGMLKVWNMVLIILTFLFTIFGTFITRSGIISSVHSFGVSTTGPFFMGFMILAAGLSFFLLYSRRAALKSKHELDSLVSRESSFLLNNLVLVGITFAVWWGTIFPVISEAVRGVKLTVGAPFFNQVNVPIALILLFLTGVCPLIAWRRATLENLKRNFIFPFLLALAAALILFILGIKHLYALVSFSLSLFVLVTIIWEFSRGTKARAQLTGKNYLNAFFSLVSKNKRRYGGYIVHVGVVLMFVAFTGNAFTLEKEVTLKEGESFSIKDYTLKYESLTHFPTQNRYIITTILSVYKNGQKIGTLRPEKNFYGRDQNPTTEVAIRSTLKEDLYLVLVGYTEDKTASFKAIINPLVSWLWIGGWVLAFGTLIALWPDREQEQRLKGEFALLEDSRV